MSAYIKTLKNTDGDIIYPQTKTSAIYNNDGVNIEDQLNQAANKADKVSSVIAGDLAGLDANGNLTDSGKKIEDFATKNHKSNHAIGGSDVLKSTDLGIDATTASKYFSSVAGTETVDQVLSLLGAAALKSGSAIKDALGNLITLPSAQLDSRVQIATVKYQGTGTFGINNPTTIVFPFAPQLITIAYTDLASSPPAATTNAYLFDLTDVNDASYTPHAVFNGCHGYKSSDGKTLYLYADDSTNQFNYATYAYIIRVIR